MPTFIERWLNDVKRILCILIVHSIIITMEKGQALNWGRMDGALAQALSSQQLQHREAMTSFQEQRFELEERPFAVLAQNAIE